MEDQNKQPISGYVVNVSLLKIIKAKRSYFESEVQNSTNQSRTTCFSHEKRKLATEEDQNTGWEYVNFKKFDNGDLLVTNSTSEKATCNCTIFHNWQKHE